MKMPPVPTPAFGGQPIILIPQDLLFKTVILFEKTLFKKSLDSSKNKCPENNFWIIYKKKDLIGWDSTDH